MTTDEVIDARPAKLAYWRAVILLVVAAVLVLTVIGFYSRYMNRLPANLLINPADRQLAEGTLDQAIAKLRPDPNIEGYVDTMEGASGHLVFKGWAVDKGEPLKPVSVVAFVGQSALEAVSTKGARPDVSTAFKLPAETEPAFLLATSKPCRPGTPLTFLAVTQDGRYAVTKFYQLEGVCPR